MRNILLFSTIVITIAVSMLIGVTRAGALSSAPAVTPLSSVDFASSPSSSTTPSTTPPSPSNDTSELIQPQKPTSPLTNVPSIGSVQVLNGCGVTGAADRMADFLRSKNFDVKDKGNAPSWNYPATMVIARGADMGLANEIERILKTGKVQLIRNRDEHLYDVTVIVGPDYEKYIKN